MNEIKLKIGKHPYHKANSAENVSTDPTSQLAMDEMKKPLDLLLAGNVNASVT